MSYSVKKTKVSRERVEDNSQLEKVPHLPLNRGGYRSISFKNDAVEVQQENVQQEVIEQMHEVALSPQVLVPLRKLLKYQKHTFYAFATTELKVHLEEEVKRYQFVRQQMVNLRSQEIDQEICIIVLLNHVKALMDLKMSRSEIRDHGSEVKSEYKEVVVTHKMDSKEAVAHKYELLQKYEVLQIELERDDREMVKFIAENFQENTQVSYGKCKKFFTQMIDKLRKNRKDKFVISRVCLLEIIIDIISMICKEKDFDEILHAEFSVDEGSRFGHHEKDPYNTSKSFHCAIGIEEKVYELSQVSEQIPQLQIFKRNLQLEPVQSDANESFGIIVDVLINLHHKVNELMKNQPKKLIREMECIRAEVRHIFQCGQQFLTSIESDTQELRTIEFHTVFESSRVSEDLKEIKNQYTNLSKIIILQDMERNSLHERIERIKEILTVFENILNGTVEYEAVWPTLIKDCGSEYEDIFVILSDCISCFFNAFKTSRLEEGEDKTKKDLEDEINNLIREFQQIKEHNSQLQIENDELRTFHEEADEDIMERDNIIQNLTKKVGALEKKNAQLQSENKKLRDTNSENQQMIQDISRDNVSEQANEEIFELQTRLKELTEINKSLKNKYNEERQRNQQYLQTISEKSRQLEEEQTNRQGDLQSSRNMMELQQKLNELEAEKDFLDKSRSQQEQNCKLLLAKLQKANAAKKQIEKQYQTLETHVEAMEGNMWNADKEKDRFQRGIEQMNEKIKEYQLELEDKDLVINDLKRRLKDLLRDMNTEEATLKEHYDKINQNLRNEINAIIENSSKAQIDKKKMEARIHIIEEQNQQLLHEIEKYKQDLKKLRNYIEELEESQYRPDFKGKYEHTLRLFEEQQNHSHALELELTQLRGKLALAQQHEDQTQIFKKEHYTTIQHETIKIIEEKEDLKEKLEAKISDEGKLKSEVDRLEKEINRMHDELMKIIEKLREKEMIIERQSQKEIKLQKSLEDIESENCKQLSKVEREHQAWKNQILEKNHQYQQMVANQKREIDQLKNSIDYHEKKNNSSKADKDRVELELREYESKCRTFKKDKQEASDQIEDLERKLSHHNKEIQSLEDQLQAKERECRELRNQKDFMETQMHTHTSSKSEEDIYRINQLQQLKETLERERGISAADNKWLKNENERLTGSNSQLKADNIKNESEKNRANQEIISLKAELDVLRKIKEELTQANQKVMRHENEVNLKNKDQINEKIKNYQTTINNLSIKMREKEQQFMNISSQSSKKNLQLEMAEGEKKLMMSDIEKMAKQIELCKVTNQSLKEGCKNITTIIQEVQRLKNKLSQCKCVIKDQQIHDLQSQIEESTALRSMENNKLKDANFKIEELRKLLNEQNKPTNDAQKSVEVNQRLESMLSQSGEEISYLKQKIRILEQTIETITAENSYLTLNCPKQAGYSRKQTTYTESKRTTINLTKQAADSSLVTPNKNSVQQTDKSIVKYQEQILNLQGQKNKLTNELSAEKQKLINLTDKEKGIPSLEQVHRMKKLITECEERIRRYQRIEKGLNEDLEKNLRNYCQKESAYLEEIKVLKQDLFLRNQKIDLLDSQLLSGRSSETPAFSGDKYYLRSEGEHLRQLIDKVQNGSDALWGKIGNMQNSRTHESVTKTTRETLYKQLESDKLNIPNDLRQELLELIKHNRTLIESINQLNTEREEILLLIKLYPNPEYISEYVFKILIYFSQISIESPEANGIFEQLQNLKRNYNGGQYFIVLEQYTKFVLENNMIEQYKHQLKEKALELIEVKQKLDIFIREQIEMEERMLDRSEFRASMYGSRQSKGEWRSQGGNSLRGSPK